MGTFILFILASTIAVICLIFFLLLVGLLLFGILYFIGIGLSAFFDNDVLLKKIKKFLKVFNNDV